MRKAEPPFVLAFPVVDIQLPVWGEICVLCYQHIDPDNTTDPCQDANACGFASARLCRVARLWAANHRSEIGGGGGVQSANEYADEVYPRSFPSLPTMDASTTSRGGAGSSVLSCFLPTLRPMNLTHFRQGPSPGAEHCPSPCY